MQPEDVDIRLAVGVPRGNQAIKTICPLHEERLGVPDDVGSLAVYRANLHCFGCGFHIRRRYAALAFLLGEWDGRGSEDGERCRVAVRRVQKRIRDFVGSEDRVSYQTFEPPPPDPMTVEAFHQFLLTVMEDRMIDALQIGRGFSLATIRRFRLGHTGTHFSIPVYDLSGSLYTIRYRADSRWVDESAEGYRKYDGTWGRNNPYLYPLPVISGLLSVAELWVVEGEFDAISGNQAGDVTLTVTNGATNISKLPELLAQALPTLLIGRWVIATDQDEAGEKAARSLLSVLSGRSAVRARWRGGKDLTDYYAAGGSREEIWYDTNDEADIPD